MWECEETLLDAGELVERGCDACMWEWELWQRIIESTTKADTEGNVVEAGSARWGEIAFEMLALDEWIEVFRIPATEITAIQWEFLRAVRHERSRRSAWHQWKANQKQPGTAE